MAPRRAVWLAYVSLSALLYYSIRIHRDASPSIAYSQAQDWDGRELQADERVNGASSTLVQNKYSIVISTYDRIEHLHQFLHTYGNGSLARLDAIFVAWGLGDVDPPSWLDSASLAVPVHFERARRNSLAERFRKPAGMRTLAGFWIDDDLAFRQQDIEFAFDVYRDLGQDSHRIVGFSGRLTETEEQAARLEASGGERTPLNDREADEDLDDDDERDAADEQWTYELFKSPYSMILTNSAFLDQTMLDWFWADDERIRRSLDFVDVHMNCEDILFNFVVADRNHRAPILVERQNLRQVMTSGISNQGGHYEERRACVQHFAKIWGMPLQTSRLRVSPNSREKSPTTVSLREAYRPTGTPWGSGRSFVSPPPPAITDAP